MSIFGNERRLFLEDEAETEKLGGPPADSREYGELEQPVFKDTF